MFIWIKYIKGNRSLCLLIGTLYGIEVIYLSIYLFSFLFLFLFRRFKSIIFLSYLFIPCFPPPMVRFFTSSLDIGTLPLLTPQFGLCVEMIEKYYFLSFGFVCFFVCLFVCFKYIQEIITWQIFLASGYGESLVTWLNHVFNKSLPPWLQ